MRMYALYFVVAMSCLAPLHAQNSQPTPGDTLRAITYEPDGTITLRIYAPEAHEVKIGGTDIGETYRRKTMQRLDNGVWEVNIGPLPPGAYRYRYDIDRVPVMDPRNPSVSESNENAWSLLTVPAAGSIEEMNIPHGAIAEVTYYSETLKRSRRMHVYTPHGYEAGQDSFPVFYLLHGAYDTDDAWPTIGRTGAILDNLIAENKVVPMIVVMPAGHTGPFPSRSVNRTPTAPRRNEFVEDFVHDLKPYIEEHYRIIHNRRHRAIAGLSMGGAQTLDIAIPHLSEYGYVGVFSSGIFELGRSDRRSNATYEKSWEERNATSLDDDVWKMDLKVFWFATGKEDFLLTTSRNTVEMFRRHGFAVSYKETDGAHTWDNWRSYLGEFAQLLFK